MTPFEETLEQINVSLNTKLNDTFNKIKVQGYHRPGNTQLVFTIFDKKSNYHLEFSILKNLRMFKPENDEKIEKDNIEKIISSISVLNNYINF